MNILSKSSGTIGNDDGPATLSSQHCQLPYKSSNIAVLFLLGMVLVCVDIVNIDLGGFKLKIAYVAFIAYLLIFAFSFGLKLERRNVRVSVFLLASFLPSVVLTTSTVTSLAFFAGTIMCVVIMLTFARMSFIVGDDVIGLLLTFYRFSVLLTAIFVATGFQSRGHFLFYEASYYAIALIPYLCITFFYALEHGFRTRMLDIFCICLAIVLSASVSLVLWALVSFLLVYFRSGRARWAHFVGMALAIAFLLYIAYQVHPRTQVIIQRLGDLLENPAGYVDLLVFVVGNRLQRVFVAYEAFLASPWTGVGLGALKSYATENFGSTDFSIDGVSASDFSADMNATNIYMELAAEGGVIASIGFFVLLFFISTRYSKSQAMKPLKVAFFVTMISLLIESSYLRTYVWALFGVIIGLSARHCFEISADKQGLTQPQH